MIHIGICDDEQLTHNNIKIICDSYFSCFNETPSYLDFFSIEDLLSVNTSLDLLFLDVFIDKANTLDYLDIIRKNIYIKNIIFISSYNEFVYDVFGVKTIGFVTKPIHASNITHYLNMLFATCTDDILIEFFVSYATGNRFVAASDIIYIKGQRNYCDVHSSSCPNGFLTYKNISYWEEKLDSNSFIRIHKSYIINPLYIKNITSSTIVLLHNTTLPIGRTYYKEVKSKIKNYNLNKFSKC